jgi:hypothetical protein
MARQFPPAVAAGVIGCWGALMHQSYQKEGRRQARDAVAVGRVGKDRSLLLLQRTRWVDHPVVTFLCENDSGLECSGWFRGHPYCGLHHCPLRICC